MTGSVHRGRVQVSTKDEPFEERILGNDIQELYDVHVALRVVSIR